jgi:hypothetical protein
MKMTKKLTTILLSTLAVLTFAASAQADTPWVNDRQRNQAERIYNGVANGDLSFRETRKLLRGQAHNRRLEARFKADGVVTGAERFRLHRSLNRQSNRIYRKKHN